MSGGSIFLTFSRRVLVAVVEDGIIFFAFSRRVLVVVVEGGIVFLDQCHNNLHCGVAKIRLCTFCSFIHYKRVRYNKIMSKRNHNTAPSDNVPTPKRVKLTPVEPGEVVQPAPKARKDRVEGKAYLAKGKVRVWWRNRWCCIHKREKRNCGQCSGSRICQHDGCFECHSFTFQDMFSCPGTLTSHPTSPHLVSVLNSRTRFLYFAF
jgi:hypothetical protein